MAMSLALIVAAMLAPAPAHPAAIPAPVDRSLGESDRLRELEIAIRAALARGEIDRAAADSLYLGIARTRRKMVLMGMQVGYRQRVRLRERIDALYERLEARRTPTDRSGK
jgi:hypothetical protein